MKKYLKPEVEYISLVAEEPITIIDESGMGDIVSPFGYEE